MLEMLKTDVIILWFALVMISYIESLEVEWQTDKMIAKHGYPVEIHQVVTADDFILEMQRIPAKNSSKKHPVFIQHGLWLYSASYVFSPPNISLAYALSDAGYDVWLGNVRGTPHSRHKTLSPDLKKYWDYSLDEIALYDLPTMIDYVLSATKQDKLYYIGHSMGTTLGFILLSTKSEYNEKMRLFIAEAPVAYVHHVQGLILNLCIRLTWMFADIARVFNFFTLPPQKSYVNFQLCKDRESNCLENPALDIINGRNLKEWNLDIISQFFDNYAVPFSTRVFQHFAQISNSQKFRRFDWGFIQNFVTYGEKEPTEYALEAIDTPTVFYCGLNDHLSNIKDVDLLTARLTNHIETFVVDDNEWTHIDFLVGRHVFKKVNSHIIQMIDFFD